VNIDSCVIFLNLRTPSPPLNLFSLGPLRTLHRKVFSEPFFCPARSRHGFAFGRLLEARFSPPVRSSSSPGGFGPIYLWFPSYLLPYPFFPGTTQAFGRLLLTTRFILGRHGGLSPSRQSPLRTPRRMIYLPQFGLFPFLLLLRKVLSSIRVSPHFSRSPASLCSSFASVIFQLPLCNIFILLSDWVSLAFLRVQEMC